MLSTYSIHDRDEEWRNQVLQPGRAVGGLGFRVDDISGSSVQKLLTSLVTFKKNILIFLCSCSLNYEVGIMFPSHACYEN